MRRSGKPEAFDRGTGTSADDTALASTYHSQSNWRAYIAPSHKPTEPQPHAGAQPAGKIIRSTSLVLSICQFASNLPLRVNDIQPTPEPSDKPTPQPSPSPTPDPTPDPTPGPTNGTEEDEEPPDGSKDEV